MPRAACDQAAAGHTNMWRAIAVPAPTKERLKAVSSDSRPMDSPGALADEPYAFRLLCACASSSFHVEMNRYAGLTCSESSRRMRAWESPGLSAHQRG